MKTIFSNNKFINKVFKKYFIRNFFGNFYKSIDYPTPTKGRLLIYSGIGHMYISPIEILMYHLLKSQGFEVDYCIYDESILLNEVITKKVVETVGKDKFWNRSVQNAKSILNASKVNFSSISLNDEQKFEINKFNNLTLNEIYNLKYDNIDFGDIVKGVMYRYYKSLTFDDDAVDVAKKFLNTALTNYLFVKNKNEKNKYDHVLMSHGIYCTWQPVIEFCKANEIDYICYDRAKTKANCNFNLNNPSPIWDISKAWIRLKNNKLGSIENTKVDDYLYDRILQKNDVYAYNFSEKEKDLSQLKRRLNIHPKTTVITIFTNLIWDAANVSRDIAFESPIKCIERTINMYKNDSTIHILIRTHPAERVLGTKEQYGKIVRGLFNNLPKNVTIIEPDDNINSFSVLEITDIGVVHTSTVGLELAIEGKATILISETHYRNKGFTYDAKDESHYFDLIDKLLNKEYSIPNQVELARKYFYIMMFEYQHEMPMTFSKNGSFNGYGYDNFKSLYRDTKLPIHKIIDQITNGDIQDFVSNSRSN